MHIVYVTWHFIRSKDEVLGGGIDNYLYKISKYMQKKGHCVTIVAAGNRECQWQYEGIPVYTVKVPFKKQCERYGWSKWFVPICREIAFNKVLAAIDQQRPITIVQYVSGNGTGMLYNKKFPAVLWIPTYSRIEHKGFVTGAAYHIPVLYERMAAQRFSYIFAPSKSWGVPLEKEIGKKVSVIHTPYEIEEGLAEDESVYHKKVDGKKYILYFGRLHPRKGTETIARCLYAILDKHKNFIVCFAGPREGSWGNAQWRLLRQSAREYKDRVLYAGNLKHEQLYPLIRHAECILMPSISDNLPNACLEALLLNGIVIGTKGASFDEIYVDGKSGYLIEPDNSDQLLQKVEEVLAMSDSEKERMKNNAKEVLQGYTFDKLGRTLEKYYEKAVMGSRRCV